MDPKRRIFVTLSHFKRLLTPNHISLEWLKYIFITTALYTVRYNRKYKDNEYWDESKKEENILQYIVQRTKRRKKNRGIKNEKKKFNKNDGKKIMLLCVSCRYGREWNARKVYKTRMIIIKNYNTRVSRVYRCYHPRQIF